MACSRTPKCRLRAPYRPAATSPSPLRCVRFDSVRSAEPPISARTTGASALSTLPEAARVAIAPSVANAGNASSQPSGSSPASAADNSAARSGCAAAYEAKRSSHAARHAAPRSTARRACASAASGTWNGSACSHP